MGLHKVGDGITPPDHWTIYGSIFHGYIPVTEPGGSLGHLPPKRLWRPLE